MGKPALENPSTNKQTKDITIIIASVDYDEENTPYAITRRFCGDLEGNIEDFINEIKKISQVMYLDKMKAF